MQQQHFSLPKRSLEELVSLNEHQALMISELQESIDYETNLLASRTAELGQAQALVQHYDSETQTLQSQLNACQKDLAHQDQVSNELFQHYATWSSLLENVFGTLVHFLSAPQNMKQDCSGILHLNFHLFSTKDSSGFVSLPNDATALQQSIYLYFAKKSHSLFQIKVFFYFENLFLLYSSLDW